MGSIYGYFRDVEDVQHKITIEGDHIKGDTEYVLGGTPFTTQMDESDNLYTTTIKPQGATVTIVTKGYPFDIYSPTSMSTRVKLTKGDIVEWVGFVVPQMFDMRFREFLEQIEIPCIDGLSVLQDIPYRAGNKAINDKPVSTFKTILGKIFSQVGIWKNLYVTDNVQLSLTSDECILEKLKVSENNYFDDSKSDDDATDDDTAKSCYDTLDSILLFLGYTIFQDAEDLYIIDWDAIKKGRNQYYRYTINGANLTLQSGKVTKAKNVDITGFDHAKTNETLSLADSYNYCRVRDEFYVIEDLVPSLDDDKGWINCTAAFDQRSRDISLSTNYVTCDKGIVVSDTFTYTTKNGKTERFQIFIAWIWKTFSVNIYKFYRSDNYILRRYDCNNNNSGVTQLNKWNGDIEGDGEGIKVSDLIESRYNGSFLVKYYQKNLTEDELYDNFEKYWSSRPKGYAPYKSDLVKFYAMPDEQRKTIWANLLGVGRVESIALSTMLIHLNCKDKGHIWNKIGGNGNKSEEYLNDGIILYPYFEIADGVSSVSVANTDGFIKITGQITYDDEVGAPVIVNEKNAKDLHRAPDYKYAINTYIVCELRVGDQYWNGTEWTPYTGGVTPTFQIPWWDRNASKPEMQNKNTWGKFFDFIDNSADYGQDIKGYYVPMPAELALSGNVVFKIFANRNIWGRSDHGVWKGWDRYQTYKMFIKNLRVEPIISNGIADDMENDSDTVYRNFPDKERIEMDEIVFTTCTDDAKKSSYSTVSYDDKGVSKLLQETINKALYDQATKDSEAQCNWRQEEWMVYKQITQYEKPRVKCDFALHSLDLPLYTTYTDYTINNRVFVAHRVEKNWRLMTTDLQLIEKA